jgi:hypothetical protein
LEGSLFGELIRRFHQRERDGKFWRPVYSFRDSTGWFLPLSEANDHHHIAVATNVSFGPFIHVSLSAVDAVDVLERAACRWFAADASNRKAPPAVADACAVLSRRDEKRTIVIRHSGSPQHLADILLVLTGLAFEPHHLARLSEKLRRIPMERWAKRVFVARGGPARFWRVLLQNFLWLPQRLEALDEKFSPRLFTNEIRGPTHKAPFVIVDESIYETGSSSRGGGGGSMQPVMRRLTRYNGSEFEHVVSLGNEIRGPIRRLVRNWTLLVETVDR